MYLFEACDLKWHIAPYSATYIPIFFHISLRRVLGGSIKSVCDSQLPSHAYPDMYSLLNCQQSTMEATISLLHKGGNSTIIYMNNNQLELVTSRLFHLLLNTIIGHPNTI
jgi:hypothetical protein